MRFRYEYKTRDNEKREGVISASSRDDAYRRLRSEGVRPSRVALAPGLVNRILSFGTRGLIIAVLFALCLVLCAVLIRTARRAQGVRRAAQASDRHQLYGDPAIMEEMEATAYANVFTHPGERFLAFYAQPGRSANVPPGLRVLVLPPLPPPPQGAPRPSRGALPSCLTNSIVFSEGDPREVTELKQMVNGIKEELRAYLAVSTAEEFVRCLDERQREEQMIYARVLNELEGSSDPKLLEDRNRSLRELGLPTVPRRLPR